MVVIVFGFLVLGVGGLELIYAGSLWVILVLKERRIWRGRLKEVSSPDLKSIANPINSPVMKEIETLRGEDEVANLLHQVEVPWILRNKYSLVLKKLTESQTWNALTVEESHDLSVISNQLVETTRIYESLPKSEQNSKQVKSQLDTQLTLFLKAVEKIEAQTVTSSMRKLSAGTDFTVQKFSRVEL